MSQVNLKGGRICAGGDIGMDSVSPAPSLLGLARRDMFESCFVLLKVTCSPYTNNGGYFLFLHRYRFGLINTPT